MATLGENIEAVDAPTVTITGSISGSFTVDGTDPLYNPRDGDDVGSVTKVDHNRTIKYDEQIPTIVGVATITMTHANGTQIHYTLSGKRPTHKGILENIDPKISNRLRSSTNVYEHPITLEYNRPGRYSPTILKVRCYKLVNGKVSPNEKSKLVHIRFMIKN